MKKPIIVRVLLSRDWHAAFQLVWIETFKAAAALMGEPEPKIDLVMSTLLTWSARRSACLRMGIKCAEEFGLPELACAWTACGIESTWPKDDEPVPERGRAFVPVFFALGDAITEDPALLDDLDFSRTVLGWRFMCDFGVSGEDPILDARMLGQRLEVDNDELLRWAHKWRQGGAA